MVGCLMVVFVVGRLVGFEGFGMKSVWCSS